MKRIVLMVGILVILTLALVVVVTPVLAASPENKIKYSQITTDSAYDRNPSILRASDNTFWLFFARGRDIRNIRDFEAYNPDLDYYDIYYKTSKSLPGLQKASENIIPLKPPDNAQRDIAALQAADGKIWVFTSTGLGPGSERATFYYIYDGIWHGPTPIPNTYDAHVNAYIPHEKFMISRN